MSDVVVPMRPARLCNLERLVDVLTERELDGVVSYYSPNAYYLSGYTPAGMHSIHEANGNAAVVISRRDPQSAVMLLAEQYITYFTHQPTWIADVRPYASGMSQLDLPVDRTLDRFITADLRGSDWARRMREHYEDSLTGGITRALSDLGIDRGRVAFDNLRLARRLPLDDLDVVDGYDTLKAVRAVKTAAEVELLRQATAINEEAIRRAVGDWTPGTTWHEINRRYAVHVAELGGFSRDPSPMALANLAAGDPSAIPMQTMLEQDYVIEPGMQIGFDAHGVWQGYCWDGGKTWTVGGEPTRDGARSATAAAAAMAEIMAAMRTGRTVAELQALGRAVIRRHGVPRPEAVMMFFHGLGLEHGDMEMPTGSGYLNGRRADWAMERGMVVAVHLFCPGDAYGRHWIEDVGVVGDDGATPLFSWGFEPLAGP